MADPVFALSPISARGAAPTEADYEAIREAFMETARGRWFLTEYAKRNRNTDTNLVLDAVSRLEATLASQKQDQRDRTQEVIAAIAALVIEARSEAAVLISVRDTPDEDSPALKGVRVLREMAWTLREGGSDGRIPDLLKRQADAIEEGLKAAIDETARDHLLSIFDRLAGDIEALGRERGATAASAPPAQGQASARPEPESAAEMAAAADAAMTEATALSEAETTAFDAPQAAADAIAEDDSSCAPGPDTSAEPASAVHAAIAPEQEEQLAALHASMKEAELTWDEPEDAAGGETIAANEMAADIAVVMDDATPAAIEAPAAIDVPAAIEAPVGSEAATIAAVSPPRPLPQPVPAATMPTDRMAALEAAIMAPAEAAPSARPDDASAPNVILSTAPASSMSLGAALLEKGIVARPETPRADPLAPFRRMTQSERVAFFS